MSLPDSTFTFFKKFVHDNIAIVTISDTHSFMELKLKAYIRAHDVASIQELMSILKLRKSSLVRESFLDHMTNNETLFFRDSIFFDTMKTGVIPALLESRKLQKKLTIWSAASSSGQEIYSLMMLLLTHFPQLHHWDLKVIATDISETMLERCRQGLYSELELRRGLPDSLKSKYFRQEGRKWRIKSSLREMVSFRRINLAKPWPRMPTVDLLLLRNVLIYFDLETKQEILKRARFTLAEDGYLALGGGETALTLDNNLERVKFGATYLFRKKSPRSLLKKTA